MFFLILVSLRFNFFSFIIPLTSHLHEPKLEKHKLIRTKNEKKYLIEIKIKKIQTYKK